MHLAKTDLLDAEDQKALSDAHDLVMGVRKKLNMNQTEIVIWQISMIYCLIFKKNLLTEQLV